MEEFRESDVLWPDHHHHDCCHGHEKQLKGRQQTKVHAAVCGGGLHHPASSAPVAIPAVAAHCYCCKNDASGDEAASFVPSHVMVTRRWCSAERTACPMCEGQGRMLKGRDLRCVPTAVLRMTGFLES